jgi:hypothetical protein
MREFGAGTLKSSSGQKVTNPKQAVAIGLSEERAMGKGPPPPKGTEKEASSNPGLVSDNERRGKTAYGYAADRPERESAAEDRNEQARGITEGDERRVGRSGPERRNRVLGSFKA